MYDGDRLHQPIPRRHRGYLRRARCHYGATLLYDEAGFTVEQDSYYLDRSIEQVRNCRRAIRRVLDGVDATNRSQAGFDEAIIRALKQFRSEMTPELRQYLDARHAELQARFALTTGVEPLRCKYGFDGASKSTAPPRRQFEVSRLDGPSSAAWDLQPIDYIGADEPEHSITEDLVVERQQGGPTSMALDSHPNADDGWEFWALLKATLPGRGMEGGHITDDPFYFRFPGPAGTVPGVAGVVPGLRFSRSREHPLRPQSEFMFTGIAADARAQLIAYQSQLQAEYRGSDDVIVRTSGETKAYVEVVHSGSLLDRADWSEYVEWFIATQGELRHVLRAVYGQQLDFPDEGELSGPARIKQVRVDKVLPAACKTEMFEVKAMAERTALQPEAKLGQRFEQYLSAHDRGVCCFAIALPDGTVLTTDRCDVDGNVLYEAKSSADRMSVRLALGQVLDYGHHIGQVRSHLRLAILLPTAPAPDLVELLQMLGVGCVVEGPFGVFTDLYADANGNDFCP